MAHEPSPRLRVFTPGRGPGVAEGDGRAFSPGTGANPLRSPTFLLRGPLFPRTIPLLRSGCPAVSIPRSACRRPPLPLALCAAALLLAACGGGDGGGVTQPTPKLNVAVTGRMERGSTVSVAVTLNGAPVNAADYTLSVRPADAIQVVDNATVKLLKAGSVTVTATGANKAAGSADFTIAAPPVVVFDRVVNANRDIWRIDLDGQNEQQLTTDVGDDQDPTVAQGTVVFVSYRAGNADLWSVPLAGGANTRLTTSARDETTPALSPDGQKLAFSYLETDVTKLYTSAANGSSPQRAAPGFGFDGSIETYPTWGTGGALAFVATNNGTADVFGMTGSAAPTLLVGGNLAEVEPAYSFDGKTLAFVSNRSGAVEIYLLNVATGGVTQLTSGAGTKAQPAWTPDGRIVYTETLNGATHLRWIDPAAPGTTYLIDTGAGAVGHPAATAAP